MITLKESEYSMEVKEVVKIAKAYVADTDFVQKSR